MWLHHGKHLYEMRSIITALTYIVEEDTWESRGNLENAEELVKEFERKYGKEAEELRWQEQEEEEKEFSWELPREFMAKLLYGWEKRKYEREREKRWNENWSQWKNSLEWGNLKGGPCYESPKKELTSCVFEHLIYNLKSYNGIEI